MDLVKEEETRMNRVKRRRLGWIEIRSWVEKKGGKNCRRSEGNYRFG